MGKAIQLFLSLLIPVFVSSRNPFPDHSESCWTQCLGPCSPVSQYIRLTVIHLLCLMFLLLPCLILRLVLLEIQFLLILFSLNGPCRLCNMWPGFPDSFSYVFSLVIIPSTSSTPFPSLDDSSEYVMQLHKKAHPSFIHHLPSSP